jgi:hypothetical protein
MPTPAPSTTSVTADGAVTEGEQSRRHLRPGHILRERIRDTIAAEACGSRTVADLAPALLARTGVGPVRAAQAIVSRSHHGRVAARQPSLPWPGPARCRPAAAAWRVIA